MHKSSALARMDRALGTWNVTGSHPYLPDRVLRGRVTFERIEGGAFVRMHMAIEDTVIPEGVSIFGTDVDAKTCTMLYFDARGVARTYTVELGANGFTWSREGDFAQRFQVTISEDGNAMEGEGTMKKTGAGWEPDLRLSYVRAAP